MNDERPITLQFVGMSPHYPPVQLTIDEFHYLLDQRLISVQAKKIRPCVIAELGAWYRERNSACLKSKEKI